MHLAENTQRQFYERPAPTDLFFSQHNPSMFYDMRFQQGFPSMINAQPPQLLRDVQIQSNMIHSTRKDLLISS